MNITLTGTQDIKASHSIIDKMCYIITVNVVKAVSLILLAHIAAAVVFSLHCLQT